jgi:uncharacterized protein (DUF1501 family)
MTSLFADRRTLLKSALAAGAVAATPNIAFGQAPRAQGRKLCVIILRGAMDGCAALAPVGDPAYAGLRGGLAYSGGTEIAPGFRLHPAFQNLAGLFADGQALALHAAATSYRERSHFDGQDRLETATGAVRDGWLNRALSTMGGGAPGAVGIGRTLPLALRGSAPANNWAPAVLPPAGADTIARLADLYSGDPMLAQSLAMAIETDAIVDSMGGMQMQPGMNGEGPNAYAMLAAAAGDLLAAEGGPDLAVISLDGWDTHVRQGAETGQLANRFAGLDTAIAALRERLGPHWANSAVLMVTEFGRTVRANGAGGSDHGTGSAAFLFGGAVAGGRMIGDWPGLGRLWEDRDLWPANPLEGLMKGVLAEHWGLDRADLDRRVFPEDGAPAMSGLIRT